MADVLDRDAKEAALAKALSEELTRFKIELQKAIPGLEELLRDVPPELWEEHAINLGIVLVPELTSVYLAQADALLESIEFITVDWGLVNEGAVEWAEEKAGYLIEGDPTIPGNPSIVKTEQKYIQKIIPRYFSEQWTQGDLVAELSKPNGMFSPKRAALIARTEVTNAASEGEVGIAQELAKSGIIMVPIWFTRYDEIVCTDICEPLNEMRGEFDASGRPFWIHPKSGEKYGPPTAHPGCRCFWGQEFG